MSILKSNSLRLVDLVPLALLLVFQTCLPLHAAQLAELPPPENSPITAPAGDSPECKATPSSKGKCKCCEDPGKTAGDHPLATKPLKSAPRTEKFGTEPWPGQKKKAGLPRPVSVVPV